MSMPKEEKIIAALRHRPRGLFIALNVLVLLMFSAALAFTFHLDRKLDRLVTPEHVSTMATFDNPKAELPGLFCLFHKLSAKRAEVFFGAMFFAVCAGLVFAWLIIEIAGLRNPRLLISMWDRIKALEAEVAALKAPPNGTPTKTVQPTATRPDPTAGRG
jgi:hypothetical protein